MARLSTTPQTRAGPVYREHRPPGRLITYIECFWTRRGAPPTGTWERNRVLPDGCLDIIFNLRDAAHPEHGPGHGMAAFAVGAMTDAATFKLRGRVDFVGVRFRPGGAAALFDLSADELTDRVVSMEDIWSPSDEILDRLREGKRDAARLRALEGALVQQAGRAQTPPTIVAAASDAIERRGGRVAVGELEANLGISRRHLHRLFKRWVGLSPKTACRIARFQRAAGRLRAEERGVWSRVAYECGYHDQAHLIRDFREFAGLSPSAYLAERSRGRFVQDEDAPPVAD